MHDTKNVATKSLVVPRSETENMTMLSDQCIRGQLPKIQVKPPRMFCLERLCPEFRKLKKLQVNMAGLFALEASEGVNGSKQGNVSVSNELSISCRRPHCFYQKHRDLNSASWALTLIPARPLLSAHFLSDISI